MQGRKVTRSNIFFLVDISLISFIENSSLFLRESRFCQSNSFYTISYEIMSSDIYHSQILAKDYYVIPNCSIKDIISTKFQRFTPFWISPFMYFGNMPLTCLMVWLLVNKDLSSRLSTLAFLVTFYLGPIAGLTGRFGSIKGKLGIGRRSFSSVPTSS